MTSICAVFTGDLIGSRQTSASAVDTAINVLKTTAQELGNMYGFDPRFTRNRGDGWQLLLPDPRRALITYLALVARSKAADTGLDTRMAIGIDRIDTDGTKDLSDASGPAFITSGDLLKQLEQDRRKDTILIAGTGAERWHQAIFTLADWITQGWSTQQAEAVAMVLLDTQFDTNTARATALRISRQAFEARLKSSGYEAFMPAISAFLNHDFRASP